MRTTPETGTTAYSANDDTSVVRDGAGHDLAYLNVTLPTFSTSESQLHALTTTMRDCADEMAARLT